MPCVTNCLSFLLLKHFILFGYCAFVCLSVLAKNQNISASCSSCSCSSCSCYRSCSSCSCSSCSCCRSCCRSCRSCCSCCSLPPPSPVSPARSRLAHRSPPSLKKLLLDLSCSFLALAPLRSPRSASSATTSPRLPVSSPTPTRRATENSTGSRGSGRDSTSSAAAAAADDDDTADAKADTPPSSAAHTAVAGRRTSCGAHERRAARAAVLALTLFPAKAKAAVVVVPVPVPHPSIGKAWGYEGDDGREDESAFSEHRGSGREVVVRLSTTPPNSSPTPPATVTSVTTIPGIDRTPSNPPPNSRPQNLNENDTDKKANAKKNLISSPPLPKPTLPYPPPQKTERFDFSKKKTRLDL